MIVQYTPKAKKFIKDQNDRDFARIARVVDLLERHGHKLELPHSRHLGDGLLEMRIIGNPSFRLLYVFRGGGAVIVHAFMKKTERIPVKELDFARRTAARLD